jgi:hypothetical protein
MRFCTAMFLKVASAVDTSLNRHDAVAVQERAHRVCSD